MLVMRASAWDLLIIGSGFGGSVCACRAAEAGMRVAVLERGPRTTDDYFEQLAQGFEPLIDRPYAPALVRPSAVRGLLALSGSAVGGTSQLYTAVTVPAPPEIFAANWPAGLDADYLQPHFDRVRATISPSPMPYLVGRTHLLQQVAGRMQSQAVCLPLAMNWRSGADFSKSGQSATTLRGEFVTWTRGGVACRKRTLDQTYLAIAERAGATILPLHQADVIVPQDDGFCVIASQFDGIRRTRVSLFARRVVVAAGTLATVDLLLRCRNQFGTLPRLSPALGRRFFTNGDFGGMLFVARDELTLDAGPPVTAWIDLWNADRLFLMETGFAPILQRLVTNSISSRRRCWTFALMGFDDSPGTLQLNRRGNLVCEFKSPYSETFHAARIRRMQELAAITGGTLLLPPTFAARARPVTVHPLGGASLADSPESGVTNRFGECFGHPGLHVADGSLLPTPIGAAPSMTIAALAEHVMESLLHDRSA